MVRSHRAATTREEKKASEREHFPFEARRTSAFHYRQLAGSFARHARVQARLSSGVERSISPPFDIYFFTKAPVRARARVDVITLCNQVTEFSPRYTHLPHPSTTTRGLVKLVHYIEGKGASYFPPGIYLRARARISRPRRI